MENKTITKEQIMMLFEATYSFFKLTREFDIHFPNEEHNIFRGQFCGMRQTIEIIGLGDEYIKYMAEQETK